MVQKDSPAVWRPTFAMAPIPSCSSRDSSNSGKTGAVPQRVRCCEAPVIIFDCNGVLVDGEQIAAEVAANELARAGIAITPELVIRYFSGRRPADVLAMIEAVTRQKLPANLSATIAAATVKRLREELRAMPHAAHALIRRPLVWPVSSRVS
jgi:hypothetical protein